MTKTLTEQMKTEHGAWYYVKTKEWGICHWLLFPDTLEFEKDITEILAPVPSYEEICHLNKRLGELAKDVDKLHSSFPDLANDYKRLEKQLAIATTALKYIKAFKGWQRYECEKCADNALKEIEGVK